MQDLYRFNLVNAKLGPGRLVKLPLSVTEAINKPNIRINGGKVSGRQLSELVRRSEATPDPSRVSFPA
jgi:hypothetical protein